MRKHWKLLGLTTVIIISFASIAYAYWRNSASSPTLYVTATYPPLELRMELEKTEFQQNETIVIHLFLKNIGDETITIVFTYANDLVGFIVKDENDTEVYVHPITFLTAVEKVDLEPGDQITEYWWFPTEWDQKGNLAGKYDSIPVPPGTYKIIGRTGRFSIVGKTSPRGRIETPAIAITIG